MPIINVGQSTQALSGIAAVSTYSATTTAGTAIAANTARKRLMLFNPPSNTQTIYFGFATGVTVSTGIPLLPGQAWSEESGLIHGGLISAITSSGTANLIIWEWT